MATNLEIIVGTYDGFLLGYKVDQSKIEESKSVLSQSFATRSHTASIRNIAVSGKYIASAGADDRIFIYDMKTRREVQVLLHHEGTVNAVKFTPQGTHIFSVADDGTIVGVRTGSWQVEGIWKKAHSGSAVTQISIHPTGKVSLTLGNDLILRTWNLLKGREAYSTDLRLRKYLGSPVYCVAWSSDGAYFTLCGLRGVEIWSMAIPGMFLGHAVNSKPSSVCWISNTQLMVGLENGKLLLLDINRMRAKYSDVYNQRIKAMDFANGILATASSSGEISLWTYNCVNRSFLQKITSINIGCRPTCLALLDLTQFGDDYVLKQEKAETVAKEVEVNSEVSDKNLADLGTVVVEYEDEQIKENDETEIENLEVIRKTVKKKKKNKNKLQRASERGSKHIDNHVENVQKINKPENNVQILSKTGKRVKNPGETLKVKSGNLEKNIEVADKIIANVENVTNKKTEKTFKIMVWKQHQSYKKTFNKIQNKRKLSTQVADNESFLKDGKQKFSKFKFNFNQWNESDPLKNFIN